MSTTRRAQLEKILPCGPFGKCVPTTIRALGKLLVLERRTVHAKQPANIPQDLSRHQERRAKQKGEHRYCIFWTTRGSTECCIPVCEVWKAVEACQVVDGSYDRWMLILSSLARSRLSHVRQPQNSAHGKRPHHLPR